MSFFRYFFYVFMCLFTKLIILGLNMIMSNSLVFAYITFYIHNVLYTLHTHSRRSEDTEMQLFPHINV